MSAAIRYRQAWKRAEDENRKLRAHNESLKSALMAQPYVDEWDRAKDDQTRLEAVYHLLAQKSSVPTHIEWDRALRAVQGAIEHAFDEPAKGAIS